MLNRYQTTASVQSAHYVVHSLTDLTDVEFRTKHYSYKVLFCVLLHASCDLWFGKYFHALKIATLKSAKKNIRLSSQ
jgi:hypothetical protein